MCLRCGCRRGMRAKHVESRVLYERRGASCDSQGVRASPCRRTGTSSRRCAQGYVGAARGVSVGGTDEWGVGTGAGGSVVEAETARPGSVPLRSKGSAQERRRTRRDSENISDPKADWLRDLRNDGIDHTA